MNKFFIDHTADTGNGGYVIVTKDNCVKSVIGFSRFAFSLKPQEKLEFTVIEEATFSVSHTTISSLENFLNKQVPDLLKAKIKGLTPELIESVKEIS